MRLKFKSLFLDITIFAEDHFHRSFIIFISFFIIIPIFLKMYDVIISVIPVIHHDGIQDY